MSFDSYDYPDPASYGTAYERCVAYKLEQKGYLVVPQGVMLKEKDGGVDLVAISPDKILLVQCKRWNSYSATIHENIVNQLAGASMVFRSKFPAAVNVGSVLAATCSFADDALQSAQFNNISLQNVAFIRAFPLLWPSGGTYDFSYKQSDYEKRLARLISFVQKSPSCPWSLEDRKNLFNEIMLDVVHAPDPAPAPVSLPPVSVEPPPEPLPVEPQPEQIAAKTEQQAIEAEQIAAEPEQIAAKAEQQAIEAEQTAAEPEQVAAKPNQNTVMPKQDTNGSSTSENTKKKIAHVLVIMLFGLGFLVGAIIGAKSAPPITDSPFDFVEHVLLRASVGLFAVPLITCIAWRIIKLECLKITSLKDLPTSCSFKKKIHMFECELIYLGTFFTTILFRAFLFECSNIKNYPDFVEELLFFIFSGSLLSNIFSIFWLFSEINNQSSDHNRRP